MSIYLCQNWQLGESPFYHFTIYIQRRKFAYDKQAETTLEAWLTFLSDDSPDKIIELITKFPHFKAMYETLYQMCQNVERMMDMFSEELRILD